MRSACILVISLIWINLYGQPSNRKISLDYAGLPLKEVLKDLSNKYEVRFAYSSDFIPMDYPVRASVQNASLSEALDLIFSGTPVKYAFIGGQVALFTTDSDAPQTSRVAYIGSSNVDAGKQAGELALKALPDGGKCIGFVGL
ncbi:MAG TPA: hypothetical protein PKE06_21470, partial [Flavilitoribacter sp.]|nr:hypothetical protein [Flavilitoribacter sp.]